MASKYIIKKVDGNKAGSGVWEGIPELGIDCYPWSENGYMPGVKVKLYYTDTHIHILFKAYEKEVKAVYTQMSEPVYKDSCVEFFFNPDPARDKRYFNFEINSLGVPLIAIGPDRNSRMQIDEENLKLFTIHSSLNRENIESYNGPFWSIEYAIPFSFIKKYYKGAEFDHGTEIRANFYKCGDETKYPHYGCWSPIENGMPDFHRSEFFGTLILE